MNDFDWIEDLNTYDINNKLDKKIRFNPDLTDEVFNEVKTLVTKIWNTYDNRFGYVDEKMCVVNSLDKSWDSVIRMIKMFHYTIQMDIIFRVLKKDTIEVIKLELFDRGYPIKDLRD